ncbi:MAG: hypothetical protein A2X55_03265 [Nitrospirae bacterium GWB2_47_37]|nr:MAG: hypothetical protein A2X55_03265 [Nitrospirae bacterium GWB2_47_37]
MVLQLDEFALIKNPSMNNDKAKWEKASETAHRTSRWAKTMTKWLITKNCKNGAKWHVVNFVGTANSESRGVVDLIAIRKDHRCQNPPIKIGDLFEVVLIQVKGGCAPFPTPEDIVRLKKVAKHHRAQAVVLSEWKPKKRLQLYLLQRNKWIEASPREIF